MGYVLTHNGNRAVPRGMGRYRGLGAWSPSSGEPYPYCDPNYQGACTGKTPWASQFARDPSYSYAAGGEFGKVNYPVWAAVLAISNDGQTSNPVRNLYHLLPAGPLNQGTSLPDIADLDGQRIEPAALIAKAVDYAANGEYFPWMPGQPVTKQGPTKTYPGWNFYNDNLRPGTQFSSPAQLRAAALSSGSRSTGMPPSSIGPEGNNDAAVQRYWTFKALSDVPIERLPEAAMPFWRQSSYGLPKGQTVGGPGFPPVCPNNPMTGIPDPDCVAMIAANPQANPNCGKPYQSNMSWQMYMASQVGCPATPETPQQISIPQPPPAQPVQIIASPSPVIPIKQPGVSAPVDQAQNPYGLYTTGGGNTPTPAKVRAYSPGNRATAWSTPQQVPATQQAAATSTGAIDGAMSWVKDNPLIVGGIALAAVFMFSQGGRR